MEEEIAEVMNTDVSDSDKLDDSEQILFMSFMIHICRNRVTRKLRI